MAEINMPEFVSSVNGTDDREAHPKFWIAAYTRPRSEKKAAEDLTRLGIETYLPIQKQQRRWSDRKKYVEIPVIPMIVFVRLNEEDIVRIKSHHLIIKILTYPGDKKAARIPDNEIADLKRLLNQSDIPVSFEYGTFKAKDKIMIIRGKLQGLNGLVKEADKNTSTLWITVNLLGGSIIRIKNSDIKKIDP